MPRAATQWQQAVSSLHPTVTGKGKEEPQFGDKEGSALAL